MNLVLFVLAGIGFLLLLLLLAPIRIEVHTRVRRRRFYVLRAYVYGVPVFGTVLCCRLRKGIRFEVIQFRKNVYKRVFPKPKKKKDNDTVKAIFSHVRVKKWRSILKVGLEDPAATALAVGTLRIAGMALYESRVRGHIRICGPVCARILPDFDKAGVNLELACIIALRGANIIREYLKKKGETNASNREHPADHHV